MKRITESQLRKLIESKVKHILKENNSEKQQQMNQPSSSTSKTNYLTIIILFTTNSTISNSLFHFITFLFPSLPTHHTSFLLFIPLIIINNLIPFWFSRPFPAKRPSLKRPLIPLVLFSPELLCQAMAIGMYLILYLIL